MTPRQRLFNVLKNEPTDRTPVWLLFPYHRLGCYVDVRTHPKYRRVLDCAAANGVITLNRRGLPVPMFTPQVVREDVEVDSPNGRVRRHVLRYQNAEIYSEQSCAAGVPGKKLLASDEDLEFFCGLPLEVDEGVVTTTLESQLEGYRREQSEFPLESGAMMLDLGSPINAIYHSANLEEYAIWSLTHGELVCSWLDRQMRHMEAVYRFCLEHDLADVYFLVGSELASPPLLSRETFCRWVVPYEKRLIDMVHSYGKYVIQHYHGQIREILPDFVTMGPDGLHTIESPPTGNCTLTEAYDATRERITLIGNIQYDEFRSASPDEMSRRVREVLDEVAGRRFILSPTAGPFDENPTDRLIENYIAFIEAAGTSVQSPE